ncbi:MAG: aldo/keto reductase [Clostridium perfringens]|nr:aldo/keto reductase [Clostridium perfringens]
MEKIVLNNGVEMPYIGLGTVGIKGETGVELIKTAIDIGYRMIDTAHMYGNEKEVGEAIRKSQIPRKELFITTKLNSQFASYEKAKEGIELSLKNMKLDYIDLYLIHEPYNEALEMYQAMSEYYERGIIRAIGISNYSKRKYDAFIKNCGIIPAINQIESHVFYPQLELAEHMKKHGTKTEAWAPLAGGNGRIRDEATLIDISKKYGKTPYQIALKYIVENGISIIPKSHNVERVKSNFDIFDFNLSIDDMNRIKNLDGKETLYGWMKNWE